jgi:hypothetical protein
MATLAELPSIRADKEAALARALADRAFARPPILNATRLVGFSDAELARLLGCSPMQVNDWVKGRRPIPPVKHMALIALMHSLSGVVTKAPDNLPVPLAQKLNEVVFELTKLALQEVNSGPPRAPGVFEAAMDLANEALAKLGGGCVIEMIEPHHGQAR